MRFFRLSLVLLAATIPPRVAVTHHSVAHYDDEAIEIAGEIAAVEWGNPHIRLSIAAVNDRGLNETWRLEGNSIYNLRRSGITADLFPVGTPVVVSGYPSTRSESMMLVESVLFPDGRTVLLWDLEGRQLIETPRVDAAAENRGIFRVWSVPRGRILPNLQQLAEQPFTDAAVEARSGWDPLDNFATRCEPEGMPRVMVNPHPFEFIDRGSEITLRTELYDIERTIHMDRESPPEDANPSSLGYSIGRWDEDTLVVETSRVNWPYFDNAGTPQSPDVAITERFTLSEDQSRLDFEVVVVDDATFTEPALLRGYWEALGETIPPYDCRPLDY